MRGLRGAIEGGRLADFIQEFRSLRAADAC